MPRRRLTCAYDRRNARCTFSQGIQFGRGLPSRPHTWDKMDCNKYSMNHSQRKKSHRFIGRRDYFSLTLNVPHRYVPICTRRCCVSSTTNCSKLHPRKRSSSGLLSYQYQYGNQQYHTEFSMSLFMSELCWYIPRPQRQRGGYTDHRVPVCKNIRANLYRAEFRRY